MKSRLALKVRFRPFARPKQTIPFREGFRALLGVRKYPKNESLVLWAVAMGISAEGLDWWGLLKPGLAGLGATSVYGVVSV
ncbi:MAG: hypothetical protein O9270_07445, partial [Aquidulcibacter sp.]|uniref:hypothetical protein n=1 Tax=Aquidulcibacter sp. TaxID=2052990 RepID=UPI0022BE9402